MEKEIRHVFKCWDAISKMLANMNVFDFEKNILKHEAMQDALLDLEGALYASQPSVEPDTDKRAG